MPGEPGLPVWKGLFDWSMQYQDGTHPTEYNNAQEFTPERRAWLEQALQHYMHDFVARMTEIKTSLDQAAGRERDVGADLDQEGAGGGSSAVAGVTEQEALLDELVDIVSSIDYARDLHKIGGLPTLLELLRSRQPGLRSRAAEVLATCMANNPPVQQWFLEDGVLPPLMSLLGEDSSTVVRTKALLALSAMVRHHAACLDAFRAAGGLTLLVAAISAHTDPRLLRKALLLLQYVLGTCPTDCAAACQLGVLPAVAGVLQDDAYRRSAEAAGGRDDADAADDGSGRGGTEVRQALLSLLLELTSTREGWDAVESFTVPPAVGDPAGGGSSGTSAPLASSDGDAVPPTSLSYFRQAVQGLLEKYNSLPDDERDARQEEYALCGNLLQRLEAPPPPAPAVAAASVGAVAVATATGPQQQAQPPVLLLGA